MQPVLTWAPRKKWLECFPLFKNLAKFHDFKGIFSLIFNFKWPSFTFFQHSDSKLTNTLGLPRIWNAVNPKGKRRSWNNSQFSKIFRIFSFRIFNETAKVNEFFRTGNRSLIFPDFPEEVRYMQNLFDGNRFKKKQFPTAMNVLLPKF